MILLLLFAIFISIFILIQQPRVQTYVVHKVSDYLSKEFGNTVTVDSVNLKLFRTIEIYNVYLSSKINKTDTILYVKKFNVDLMIGTTLIDQIRHLKNGKIYVDNLDLDGTRFYGRRDFNDSAFNFQFILDQFNTKDKPKPKPNKTPKPIKIKLNRITLSNTIMFLDDKFKDERFDIRFKKIYVDVRNFDTYHLQIDARQVELVDPYFKLTYYNKKPKVIKPKTPSKGFNVQGMGRSMNLNVDRLILTNATHQLDFQGKSMAAGNFLISHMNIHSVNLDFKNYKWDSTGMHVDMNKMEAVLDNKFFLKKLNAKAGLDNNGIYLDNADIAFNDTKLKGNFSLQFKDEWRSFSDFENKVVLKAEIKDAKIFAKDIGIFAPPSFIKYIPSSLVMHGSIKGKLSNLRVEQLYVSAGKNTVIDVTGNIRGLPHVNQTLFDLEVNQFKTNPSDLKQLLTFVKIPPQLDKAGNISFKGSYFGFLNDFVAKGALNTDNLGNIVTDIQMSFPKGKPAVYSGIIAASNLNLAELTGNHKLLGKVDIDLKVNGQGFGTKDLNTKLTGTIRNFYFNGFVFDKIKVDGLVEKKKFDGKAFFDDSCFLVDFNGTADFNDTIPRYDFKTSIKNADLYKLHLTKDTLVVSLDGEVHGSGKNLDDIIGTGKFSNIILQNEKDMLALADVDINLENDGLIKSYTVTSDQFNVNAKGNFTATTIYPSMKVFLSHYSKLIKPTEKDRLQAKPQQLDITLKLKSDLGLFKVFVPQLQFISELDLDANINTIDTIFKLSAKMDSANYTGIPFNNILLNGNIVGNNLLVDATIGNMRYKKTDIPDIKLGINSSPEQLVSNLSVNTDSADNSIRLQSSIDFIGDSIIARILDSRLTVNKKIWTIQQGNELILVDSSFIAQNFSLVQDSQKINIQNGRNTLADAKINVENLNLADIDQLVDSAHLVTSGTLTGTINLKNILTKLQANVDVTINDLQVLDYKIRYIGLDAVYGRDGKKFVEAGGTLEDSDYQLSFDGTYDFQVKGKEQLDAKADIERLNLKFLETVLKKELLVPHAFVKGQINVSGSLNSPILTGKATIIDTAELKMRYLGTTFKMVNEEIDLTPKGFDFGEMTLYDNFGNTALLTGKLLHNGFKDFKAEKVNLSAPTGYNFMNTTYEDNQDFYGKVFARADVDIDGYFNNLNINVNQLETLKNSVFNLPVNSKGSDKGYAFVRFVDPKDSTKTIVYTSKVSGINLNMNITATPNAYINIILDPTTNDKITARGEGNLNLTMNKNGNISIDGTYNLIDGKYDFNFQGVVNKTFNIRPGSNISFNGDPLNAELNIIGLYNVKAASVRNIVDSTSSIRNRTFPIDLNLLITGTLKSPKIGFLITPTAGTISAQSDELNRKLDEISQNENEINNQAVALLLFNTFFPTGTSSDQRFSGASNTVTQLVSSQLSNLFSQGLGKLIPGASLDLLLSDLESKESRNFGFSYKQELFSSRLILTIGGNVNFGNTNNNIVTTPAGQPASNSAIAGDFQLEYLVTPDGRIRLKTYARTANYDIINQDKIRTGGSVSFQKEFDNFKELFARPKKADKVQLARLPDTISVRSKVNDSMILIIPAKDSIIKK
ncbi:MAG: hypothetical protein JWN78_855 [Bacteroidota bacterium]|nr:hypothetical protein [Bacteroidota bacterium]